MLVEFSVENFLSFKERITFSMLASKDTEHEDTNVVTLENGKRYLKTAVIYGANASGKSNLLKAMNFMTDFVRNSHQMQIGTPIGIVPFQLDMDCLMKPSKFDIIFISEGIKYAYGFSATNHEVIDEYLYYYPNGRQSTIFERNNVKEYRFTEDKDIQNTLKDRNTDNKLYLSTAANWNYDKVKNAYSWLELFFLFRESRTLNKILYYLLIEEKNGINLYCILKNWLKAIDTGIIDIDISIALNKQLTLNEAYEQVKTIHEVDKQKAIYQQFNMMTESDGTRRFFCLALELIYSLYYNNSNLLIDELDSHLHTLLSKFILEIYHNKEKNPNNTQLIFSTHDTNLLDLNIFRRDQIWFTEKNPDTGATDLYSLYDFGVRKDVNIEKGYLLGRYGAIPFIGGNING